MSNIRADVLKLAKGNVYQEHERFIRTFDKKWRSDENIILIMCAITLFSPDRPKTIHSDVIKLEQVCSHCFCYPSNNVSGNVMAFVLYRILTTICYGDTWKVSILVVRHARYFWSWCRKYRNCIFWMMKLSAFTWMWIHRRWNHCCEKYLT